MPRLRLRGSICHVPPWRTQGQHLLTVNTVPLYHKDELVITVRDKNGCFSEIHLKQINTSKRREQNVEFLMSKQVVNTVTIVL